MITRVIFVLNVLLIVKAIESNWIDEINNQNVQENVLIHQEEYANPSINIKQESDKTQTCNEKCDAKDKVGKESEPNNAEQQPVEEQKAPKFGPEPPPYRQPLFPGGPFFNSTGPLEREYHAPILCDDFGKRARFNPYSVLDSHWFAFFYWADDTAPLFIEFVIPSQPQEEIIRQVMDPLVEKPINWNARHVLMNDLIYNTTALLVERGDQGRFWVYPFVRGFPTKISPIEMQFKQSSDNKYIAMMECSDQRVYILSRRRDIPSVKKMPDVIALFGYHGRNGRSYLYQGHHWMPIQEMDELEYWAPDRYKPKDYDDPIRELREINGLPN